MKKKYFLLILSTVSIILAICSSGISKDELSGISEYPKAALSYYGSSGQEVRDIQDKLSRWGYYTGDIDGNYGYKTYMAIRYFQRKNGLNADGVAGADTLAALGFASQSSWGYSREVNLLAHLIHGEARGEPYIGQVAVGAVILNRTRDSRFPKTIAGVIYQPGAFDAVSDGQINLEPTPAAYRAARDALNGWDPSGGSVYYFNPSTATSRWIWSRTVIRVIGRHYFAI